MPVWPISSRRRIRQGEVRGETGEVLERAYFFSSSLILLAPLNRFFQ